MVWRRSIGGSASAAAAGKGVFGSAKIWYPLCSCAVVEGGCYSTSGKRQLDGGGVCNHCFVTLIEKSGGKAYLNE